MSGQLDLLGPHVRDSDPVTSRDAPQHLSPQRADVLARIHAIDRGADRGATVDEVDALMPGVQRNVIGRRFTDLARLGLIESRRTTRTNARGKRVLVWHLTTEGAAMR